MIDVQNLKGQYPALITPFHNDGSVNKTSMLKLTDRLIEQGADGLYLTGSTSESFLMSVDERNDLVKLICNHVKGSCKLIVQVGTLATDDAVSMAKCAGDAGAHAISAVAPFYYTYSFEELKQYYHSIADATDLPFILYNIPGFTGVDYSIEQLLELTDYPSIMGMKYTDMNLYKLERIKSARPDLLLFNGHDEVYLAAVALGVTSSIGSTYNLMIPKFINIRQLAAKGRFDLALEEQKQANSVIEILIKTGVIPGIKYLLKEMGIDAGICRQPFAPLDQSKKSLLDKVIPLLKPIY